MSFQFLTQFFEQRDLRPVNLLFGEWKIEEGGLIDFGKLLQLAGTRRPFEGESIALQAAGFPIGLDCPGANDLASLLFYRRLRNEVARGRETEFFGAFALSGGQGIFAWLNLSLGN